MAVRTGKQFLEGLRDGREIWLEGKRVEDVVEKNFMSDADRKENSQKVGPK